MIFVNDFFICIPVLKVSVFEQDLTIYQNFNIPVFHNKIKPLNLFVGDK